MKKRNKILTAFFILSFFLSSLFFCCCNEMVFAGETGASNHHCQSEDQEVSSHHNHNGFGLSASNSDHNCDCQSLISEASSQVYQISSLNFPSSSNLNTLYVSPSRGLAYAKFLVFDFHDPPGLSDVNPFYIQFHSLRV